MARTARSSAATSATPSTPATTPPAPRSTSTASAGVAVGAAAGPSGAAVTSSTPTVGTAGPSRPTRTSARSRRSVGGAVPSPPSSAGPLTPADPNPPSTPLGSGSVPKTLVAPKVHGLRNAHTARERVPCPFPADFGGQQQCGVSDEDLADDVLMAICGACATLGNIALSPDELANVAFENGWLRPPSVAVAPGTMIQGAIRTHQSRCSKASPARKPLLVKYQLSGSMAEAVLEPALHPQAFQGPSRPKGPVWYLSSDAGRVKWRNPFAGIVVPKAPVRKPAAPRQRSIKPAPSKESSSTPRGRPKKDRSATPSSSADTSSSQPPPRIKLRLSAAGGDAASQQGEESDGPFAPSVMSRDVSRSQTVDSSAIPCSTPPTSPPPQRRRQQKSVFDSSDSESSSDDEAAPKARPSQRRLVLPTFPPLAAGQQRYVQRPRMSPLGELFSPIPTPSQPLHPLPAHSPFPCHSLDNTVWGARRSIDDEPIGFDTSSSEDEDMRDPEWGTGSGVIVRAEDEEIDAELPEGIKLLEVEAKVAATTSAMSKLFSLDETTPPTAIVYNQLDNVPASDISSQTDSSTVTVNLTFQGKLKSATCANALPAWSTSSPVHSPSMAGRSLPAFVETSPTSFFRTARDWESRTMAMDVDMDHNEPWLDESGQLPVHAEETFSDLEVGSTVGDISTPERDRALHTAEWAQTTSALSMNIKQEPEDYYPSPAATSEHSSILSEPSRESSVSTASSPLSELPDLDSDDNDDDYGQEVLIGPESVHMDELDSWLPGASKSHATPGRGRGRTRQDPSRSSWGGIGVNNPFVPCPTTVGKLVPPPLVRKRSQRSSSRRNRSTPRKAERITPAPSPTEAIVVNVSPKAAPTEVQESSSGEDMELEEAIGTAELEKAAAEALAREEELRRARKQREWDECLRTFANACPTASPSTDSGNTSPGEATPSISSSAGPSSQPTPWPEMSPHWGSTDDINSMVPHPTTLSPLALQMTPIVPPADIAMMAMLSKTDPDAMAIDLSAEDLEELAAQLPPAGPPPLPAAPTPVGAPQPLAKDQRSPPKKVLNIAPRPPGIPGALKPLKPKPTLDVEKERTDKTEKAEKAPEKPKPVKQKSGSVPKSTPVAAAPAPAPTVVPAPVLAPAPTSAAAPLTSPVVQDKPPANPSPASTHATVPQPAPAPAAAPAPLQAPTPVPTHITQATPPVQAVAKPAPAVVTVPSPAPSPAVAPSPAPPQPMPQGPSQAPSQAPSQGPSPAPTRTVSPVARTTTASPTGSAVSASTSVSTPSSTSSTQSRPGGTTKRLLPGIDACVVDNLPCYSHIWDNPKGGRCTVLRRLDTDFVNGTALLTALGVGPTRIPEFLNAPSITLASHRTVPLISPQGMHHAPGVPGVWIPLVEARALAAKLGLQEATLLANILREDLFQLFKQLAGISLRHTSSTESFGMPFVTQPHGQRGKPQPRPPHAQSQPARPGVQASAKPPLVRQPTQQPDGCPQPKRRRSTVVVSGATGPQVMQQAAAPQAQQIKAQGPAQAQPPKPAQPSVPSSAAGTPARKASAQTPKATPTLPHPPMTRAQQAKIAPAPLARRTRAALSGTK
ncbi:hypothetical protein CC85DRAFT_305280 [Cutaneotrichosporon oleaginosum]|uniref:HTH APSES-type domain-containing protein n=1 Tax=Cutaneotrichosporon oleaginosum TaxID=879819 RepID=A0A0J0XDJ9_9TREE|nr:uncharacterized protein CC85DRAFT_305280 [Cutaneotrichosporon oleaginosum]KLT39156.1 hypothetical protein CC85DRAFT_305280 [Cutaneotrichosporon oleaginosum]TXT05325.1 hypothetical protein COLE_06645 [Cutaneotrichosporon oleaginosum]